MNQLLIKYFLNQYDIHILCACSLSNYAERFKSTVQLAMLFMLKYKTVLCNDRAERHDF